MRSILMGSKLTSRAWRPSI